MVELSIMDVLKIILSRIWIVIICGILCGSLAFVYCTMIAVPEYKTTASIIGSNGNVGVELQQEQDANGAVNASDYSVSEALVRTYVHMLAKLPAESEEFRTRLEEEKLWDIYKASKTSVSSKEKSLVIDISVTSTDPKAAMEIANIYAECSTHFIGEFNVGLTEQFSHAINYEKVSPNTVMTTFLAILVGAVLAALFVIYFETTNKVVSGEEDVKANYNIPILGVVPDFQISAKGGK